MILRFYELSLNDFFSLSPRLINQLIEQIPYVYEESKEFGKPPREKSKVTNSDLLKEADQLEIKIPKRVQYQMGKTNWGE